MEIENFLQKHRYIKPLSTIALFILFIGLVYYNCYIYPEIAKNKAEPTLSRYTKSEDNNLLYYDDNVSPENRTLYENALNKYPNLKKVLSEEELKIIVSGESLQDVAVDLFEDTSSLKNIKGINLGSYNMILIKDFDIFKEIELKNVQATQSKEELIALNTETNINVLYHEIGHYLLSRVNNLRLDSKKDFETAFKKEGALLFEKPDSYNCPDLKGFMAECISNYLMFGYVEYPNKDLEKNSTYSNEVTEDFLKNIL